MLRSARELQGVPIHATDGDIGAVHDFLFDDVGWSVRYLVADTRRWLPGRQVLIPPLAIQDANWRDKRLALGLTREQVENSPPIEENHPMSRQRQRAYLDHFGWQPYWMDELYYGWPVDAAREQMAIEGPRVGTLTEVPDEDADPHLRSMREVMGYHIQARDGEIGHVDDFILDDERWSVRYLVVDTRNLLPGRKVLIAPEWADRMSWADEKVHVGLTKSAVKDSPEYQPDTLVNREYEVRLYDYYGRPKYWERGEN